MQSSQLFKFIFIGLISQFLWTACSDTKRPVKNGVDAEILNLMDSTLVLESVVSPIDFIKGKQPDFTINIDVDSNGIFVRPLDLQEGYYNLIYDQNKVLYFIQHGKRLSLDFDASKPTQKPEFYGKLKYESRYLFDRKLLMANFIANEKSYFELPENEFIEVINHLRSKLDTMLVMYITNHPTGSEFFMQQEMLSNLYFEASYLEKYASNYVQIENENQIELSSDYFVHINKLNLNDTNAITNPQFYEFIYTHVWNRAGEPTTPEIVNSQLTYIDSAFSSVELRDYLYFQSATEVAKWKNTESRKEVLDTLLYEISDIQIKHFLSKNIKADTTIIPVEENNIITD